MDRFPQGVSTEEQPAADFEAANPTAETSILYRLIPIGRLLWERHSFLSRVVVVGTVISVVLAFVVPKRYESTTRLMPPDQHSGGLAMLSSVASGAVGSAGAGALSGLATDFLGMRSSGALFVAILNSRTVQDRLVEGFDLKRLYRVKRSEEARKALAEHTTISEDRKSGIITVTVTDHDARRAAEMAKGYVQELNRLVAELSTSDARREREFLEVRLKEIKQDLDAAARELSEFSSKNATLDIKEQGRATVEGAARLQGELIAEQAYLSGIEQIYTGANVRVRSSRARVAELQHELDRLGGVGQVRSDDKQLAYPSLRQLPLLGVTYADLYRRSRIEEIVFETLTKQYEVAKVQEAKQIPAVRVLDVANVPERHVFPSKRRFVAFGFVLSFVLGCAWIMGVEWWNLIESGSPGKAFVQEVYAGIRKRSPWRRKNVFGTYPLRGMFGNDGRNRAVAPPIDALPGSASKTNTTDR